MEGLVYPILPANLDRVFVALAYKISPVTYVDCPVPPYMLPTGVAFQVPVLMVPSCVILVWTALGNVDDILGTPPALVIKTPLLTEAKPVTVLLELEYKS